MSKFWCTPKYALNPWRDSFILGQNHAWNFVMFVVLISIAEKDNTCLSQTADEFSVNNVFPLLSFYNERLSYIMLSLGMLCGRTFEGK